MSGDARTLIDDYERSLSPEARRANGVHYTPPGLARRLVDAAVAALGATPRRVCDPSCGAGSFLLAAADVLVARGVDPEEIVRHRLVGGDVDESAARVARRALCSWAESHGARIDPSVPRIVVGDMLSVPADALGAPFDLVVGNPPFLSQLARRSARDARSRRAVAERFGKVGTYADTAALFLLMGLDLVVEGGVVALLQPQSFLAARDTARVRAAVLERSALVALWSSDERLFDADVRVCAPILASGSRTDVVQVMWGDGSRRFAPVPAPSAEGSWGPLLAEPLGIPSVPEGGSGRLGDVATATAGFRDEFYALCEALVDGSVDGSGDVLSEHDGPRLITVGMIDPGHLSWGEVPRRIGGERRLRPRLDVASLESRNPRVAEWAAQRCRPKVLVATQTKVIEAAADPLGDCVPVTPTISLEPIPHGPDLWHLTAALLAPPASARALSTHTGAGLSQMSLRWSARSALDVALPVDPRRWAEGARLVESMERGDASQRRELLGRLGVEMTLAHGLAEDHPVLDWWRDRCGKLV